ncbi:MAG: hypothetical protein AAGD18_17055 [Actinomycetota bacterium]
MTHRRHADGSRRVSRRLRFLQRKLELDDEQVAELRERLGRHRAEARELFRAHRRERMEIIRSVLDEEQAARFDAAVERRRSRHHHHHRRGGERGSDLRA